MKINKLTGNKGEWSELYALIKLLEMGKLYAADENAERIPDMYFPIIMIFREEAYNHITFEVYNDEVIVGINDKVVNTISKDKLRETSTNLYQAILNGSEHAFPVDEAEEIMDDLCISSKSAPNTQKADISMQIHDIQTGYDNVCGFSIKSELGHAPTLLNASKATNFVYEVHGINKEIADCINKIESKNKILDRINEIKRNHGFISFKKVCNDSFLSNLMLIDSKMELIIATMLEDYYTHNLNSCAELVNLIEDKNGASAVLVGRNLQSSLEI